MSFSPQPPAMQRMRLLIGTAPDPVELDIDELDFVDPYPTAEELLIAAEILLGRGYWATGKTRPPAPLVVVTKKWRPAVLDEYKKNDPRGWMGDPKRGAALGRKTINTLPRDYAGYIYVREVILDDGGYDCLGTYFGHGKPLWWCAANGDDHLDRVVRGTAEDVVAELKNYFPNSQICFAPEKIE